MVALCFVFFPGNAQRGQRTKHVKRHPEKDYTSGQRCKDKDRRHLKKRRQSQKQGDDQSQFQNGVTDDQKRSGHKTATRTFTDRDGEKRSGHHRAGKGNDKGRNKNG